MLRKKSWVTPSCLILLLVLIMFFTGCSVWPEYYFVGRIGDEQISTREFGAGCNAPGLQLRVEKPDGSIIIYRGEGEDERKIRLLDVTVIPPAGDRTTYKANSFNPLVQEIVQKAQIQFDYYLKKILETKTMPLFSKEATPG